MTFPLPIESLSQVNEQWIEAALNSSSERIYKIKNLSYSNSYTSDGFLSDIEFVTVHLEDGDLPIVIKILPTGVGEEMKAFLIGFKVGKIEASFNAFLASKCFKEFIKDKNASFHIPHVYYSEFSEDSMTLVMDNMLIKGFNRILEPNGVSLAITLKAVIAIANFHGLMYCYYKKHSSKKLKSLIPEANYKREILEQLIITGFQKALEVSSNKEIVKQINNLIFSGKAKYLFDTPNSSLEPTFIHGDYWTGQLLYNDESACILDWQFLDFGNPMIDIATFIFMSCNASIFDSMDEIIDTYFATLMNTLVAFEETLEITRKDIVDSLDVSWGKGLAILISSVETFLPKNKITEERLEGLLLFACKKGLLNVG